MCLRVCRSSMIHIEVCFDAIKMLLAARCDHPFTNDRFPPATLISTLRIFKEQAAFQLQTSTSHCAAPPGALSRRSGLQPKQPEQCVKWWRMTGSNRRPPACKAGALPAELIPRLVLPGLGRCAPSLRLDPALVGLVGFEPTTPALSRRCSNRLSYRPNCLHSCSLLNQQPISVGA